MAAHFTLHAGIRLQQRAIPPTIIELLRDFGSAVRSNGADSHSFDKAARRCLASDLGEPGLRLIERHRNVYAVFGDNGCLITAARRRRRFRRP